MTELTISPGDGIAAGRGHIKGGDPVPPSSGAERDGGAAATGDEVHDTRPLNDEDREGTSMVQTRMKRRRLQMSAGKRETVGLHDRGLHDAQRLDHQLKNLIAELEGKKGEGARRCAQLLLNRLWGRYGPLPGTCPWPVGAEGVASVMIAFGAEDYQEVGDCETPDDFRFVNNF